MGLTTIGIAILGFCACCIGYYFAAVIIEFMVILAYFDLRGSDAPEATATEPSDYVEVQ